jgi:spore germination protein GerM
VALLAAALIVLAGCAPASTHGVHKVPDSAVPFGLMSDTGTSGATQPVRGPTTQVYLIHKGRLVAVARHVIGSNIPAEALRSLLAGPSPAEIARGTTSEIPLGTHLLSLDVSGRIATVDLSIEFGSLGGDPQTEAVAQIVFTATESPLVTAVRFAINGTAIEVPDGTGSLSSIPRTRGDYRALAPR